MRSCDASTDWLLDGSGNRRIEAAGSMHSVFAAAADPHQSSRSPFAGPDDQLIGIDVKDPR